ncbi:MAG: DUF1572 domain-containing protein [bacterium]|nr:DUF1572 domain-containing protein [bacterium]
MDRFETLAKAYVDAVRNRFDFHRKLAERAVAQVADSELSRVPGPSMSSIDALMKHMAGNLRSRYTDFLTTDGEKSWRDRDQEFVETPRSREAILDDWKSGWDVLFSMLDSLAPDDLLRTVTVRSEPHTVPLAIDRQVAHQSYHVGQIVLMAREMCGSAWESLSIPRGESKAFNADRGHN